jgi:hypothetical protein
LYTRLSSVAFDSAANWSTTCAQVEKVAQFAAQSVAHFTTECLAQFAPEQVAHFAAESVAGLARNPHRSEGGQIKKRPGQGGDYGQGK